jgi:hypothetical protein
MRRKRTSKGVRIVVHLPFPANYGRQAVAIQFEERTILIISGDQR